METVSSSLVIASYNCRGFNNTKSSYINNLMQKCNFLFIQEHWLSNAQFDSLCVGNNTLVHGVSGFDNSQVLRGRPFGGAAILWHKNMNAAIKAISVDSNRIVALVVEIKNTKLLLINVYLPVNDGSYVNVNDLYDELFNVQYLVESHSDCMPIIGGDFNVDWSRDSYHAQCLSDFVATQFTVYWYGRQI